LTLASSTRSGRSRRNAREDGATSFVTENAMLLDLAFIVA